jgi:hypothetical protein
LLVLAFLQPCPTLPPPEPYFNRWGGVMDAGAETVLEASPWADSTIPEAGSTTDVAAPPDSGCFYDFSDPTYWACAAACLDQDPCMYVCGADDCDRLSAYYTCLGWSKEACGELCDVAFFNCELYGGTADSCTPAAEECVARCE